MKIGIDARMHGSGYGIGRYASELIPRIIAKAPQHEYVLFVKTEEQRRHIITDIQKQITTDLVIRFVLTNIHWYSLKEQVLFTSVIKKQKVDLMHFLHWNIPYLYSGRYLVTIHDLTMFHFARPEATTLGPITYWIKDKAHRFLLQKVVQRAEVIITPSHFVAEDVEKTFGNTLDKTTVTHLAPFEKHSQAIDESRVLKKFKLTPKRYLLYVGAAYPHKNIPAMIAAWRTLLQQDPEALEGYELILVGKPSSFYAKIEESVSHIQSIRTLGFVPDLELEVIYKQASAFVFASLSEGFGIPPLEAMSRNVPVLSSLESCLPEVLGEAAVYTVVGDPQDFAESMKNIIHNEQLRAKAICQGRSLVQRYSWNTVAEKTVVLYQ